ncbi:carbohydrate-binding module family 32 [Melanomma pulvis-pyrius CBS 109.77]|uniref:Carbohydrate-binding module family 32 n=1 Tax=Melanomma pulvis-pyrius CBS 109.77 TaxID=1314802 RepID=A0A6A6XSJ6_9PLEO|nr:carbohydrate-binding module family 32 [Melanomma pulvis-pyrius CBS 109.77]
MGYFTMLLLPLLLLRAVRGANLPISRTGWTATADSFRPGNEPSKAIDSNAASFWHSNYGPDDPLPNSITIDMQTQHTVTGVSIQPRQDGRANGRIGQHQIELSTDGTNWGAAVAIGTYLNDALTKKTTFVARPARYVRITAFSEAQGQNYPWTSVAEINVFANFGYTPRTAWSVSADSENAGNAAAAAVDGQVGTIWHTQYRPTTAPLPHWFQIDQGAPVAVAGLSYLPRSDGGNGRIGQYTVQSSSDGSTWTQVASGTWADDAGEKVAQFTASARYFRLNALTEAGNRGGWSSAAEINLIDPAELPSTPPVATKGLWIHTVDFPLVPAAVAMLSNGKVLLWSAFKPDEFGGTSGFTQTAIWDPTTGVSTQRTVSNTAHDMFCPGISIDYNGRVVVTGGSNSEKTSIYVPGSDSWLPGPNMQIPRGYQSTATTSDGRIFNIGGSWSGGRGGKNGEIYDPVANTWSLLSGALVSPMLTVDTGGPFRTDNHGWLFGWKNQYVFQAGPSKAMNWYNTVGSGSVGPAGLRADDGDAMNGNAVMYDAVAGKILTMGGAQNYATDQARANAFVITIGTPATNVAAVRTASMAYARGFANGVVLPDGTVLVTGGQATVEPFTDITAALTPELWNPATGLWTQLSPMSIPRTYHSVAILLPDATVLNGGGGLCGATCTTNHWDAEIFVPPYLLNPDGTRRARPAITTVADTVSVGGTLTVATSGAVASFSLIRLGTSTHTVDTDQRRIALTSSGSGTSYTMTIPNDPGIALPGYWFLFAINAAGTPSVAKTVKVTPT